LLKINAIIYHLTILLILKYSHHRRLTFYPTEQENLISTIHHQNTQQNALYTIVFTIIPLTLTLPFIFTFPSFPLISVLGITSLLISTGRMRFSSPLSSPPPPIRRSASRSPAAGISKWLQLTDFEHRLLDVVPENGPLRMALPWLNGAICTLLGLTAVVLYHSDSSDGGRGGGVDETWIFCLLPGIAWAMVEVAMRSMRDVEEGVGELKRLRYRYKGA
jgi:hypothetical protein